MEAEAERCSCQTGALSSPRGTDRNRGPGLVLVSQPLCGDAAALLSCICLWLLEPNLPLAPQSLLRCVLGLLMLPGAAVHWHSVPILPPSLEEGREGLQTP